MIKRLLALLVFLNFSFAYAQTIKTDVLVIGGSPAGVAAAIQSARSKVKTILVESSARLCQIAVGNDVRADHNLPSGIWGEFRKWIIEHYKHTQGYDTTYNAPLNFEPDTASAILSRIADTVKNLTIDLNTSFASIKKDDDRWDVVITKNGKAQTIKARVVIDATGAGEVISKAGAKYNTRNILHSDALSTEYRTSIAMGDNILIRFDTLPPSNLYPPYPAYIVPLIAIIAKGADNLLDIGELFEGNASMYLPLQLTLGQGAGVVAAYCAFYKTTTNNLSVRRIQTELLDFNGYLLPFEDISTDPHWRDIQQICATGMLKGVQKTINGHTEFIFDVDSTVTTAEIKPVILEIYTRAFLWFNKEKPGKNFTIGNLLSLISEITLNDPDNLQKIITHDWNTKYKFKSDFDMERPITRREFAILTNKYLNPFARTVNMDGRVVN